MKINDIELNESSNLNMKSTIEDAFKQLNGIYGMVITVVDDDKKLCGIVTDGDLRRAILDSSPNDLALEQVMNKNPVVINEEDLCKKDSFDYLFEELGKQGINSKKFAKIIKIPVLDCNKKVLGLLTMEILERYSNAKDFNYTSNKKYKYPHILIVGGAGYIGSILTEMLLKLGWRVRVLDNLLYSQKSLYSFMGLEEFSFLQGDVCDLNTQVESIKGIDCVVFLAEIVGDPSCEYLPERALKTNYLAVNSMATLCAHTNINRFIYTSSCSVYGASPLSETVLNEHSELNPVSHYGRMKILTEQVLFNQLNPLFSPTILRLATVFGHSHRPRFDLVVNTFAKNAYYNGELTIHGGKQWRPNVHVKDVARAIINVIDAPLERVKKETFNVGGNTENYTIIDIANFTREVFLGSKIIIEDDLLDKRNYRVEFSKIHNVLGFKPEFSVIQGLQELKTIFDSGMIRKPNDKKYSNIESLVGAANV